MKPIDSERLCKEISKSNDAHATNGRERSLLDRNIVIIDEQPIVECQPVIHAHWILAGKTRGYRNKWRCSNCNVVQSSKKSKYCRECGSIMDEEDG